MMSVFQTGRESDLAALRLFLVNSAVNGYQSFQLRVGKAAACDNKISVFLNVAYARAGVYCCASRMGSTGLS